MRFLFVVMMMTFYFFASAQCISGNCNTGKGTFVFKSGGKYTGTFKNHKLNGKGTFYFTNGNIYKGNWKNNFREGKGKMIFATGDTYTGQFKANKFWGKGTYKFSTGEKYIGVWQNDKAVGNGVYVFSNGERYEGEFRNGKFNGQGTYYYKNGSKFTGRWKDNKRDGEGKIIDAHGQIVYGIWKNDKLVKRNQTAFENEKNQEVVVKEDDKRNCNKVYCKTGKGIYTYKDGSKWEGEFKDGKPFGSGICYYSNGRRYEGTWKKGAPHGEGIMYFPSGEIYGGIWDKGTLVKQEKNEINTDQEEDEILTKVKDNPKVNIWALVIGIGNYDHMPVLQYTDDDAYQVYAFLKSPEGGAVLDNQIKLLIDENATKSNIENSLNFIVSNADKNDVVFIYFAGHGLEGSFVPYDYDGYNNLLMHKNILKILDKSRAKHKLLIADACHSGSMIAQRSPFKSMLSEYYLDFEKTRGGTALIMSSKENENSLEYSGMRQGVFSYFLIQGLRGEADFDKNGIVNVAEIFDYVYINVRKYTKNKQTPIISGDYDKQMPVSVVKRDW